VYACWGHENREAAVRVVTGSIGERDDVANVEVKCFDQSANPYLAIGAAIAAGLDGIATGATLPDEIAVDPASLGIDAPARLPESLDDAIAALEADAVVTNALGSLLCDSFVATRRAEADAFRDSEPDAIAAAHRWRY
jgi:glutamine synthetase